MAPESKRNKLILLLSVSLLVLTAYLYRSEHRPAQAKTGGKPKLYWFIPDGFRADREQFNIFKWAEEGELPNLKRMMDQGCYGYSRPVFPGHTPTNFATLMTGTSPAVHGIADGTMRLLGYPLNMVVNGGFSSFAKLVPPIWVQLEKSGSLVSLQSIPGSTPPELFEGNTIKGRWGAWGVEAPAIVFQDNTRQGLMAEIGQNKRLFTLGSDLTRFSGSKTAEDGRSFEVDLTNWGYELSGKVYRSSASAKSFDRVQISHDRKTALADLAVGEWSDWLPVPLRFQLKEDYQRNTPKKSDLERDLSAIDIDTFMKVKVIRLGGTGEYRIRILYDGLNEMVTSPSTLSGRMREKVGHMVDFVDNYPPQLVYFAEDQATFLEEADLSWDWHRKAVPFLIKDLASDVVIHSIYTPNQMLTSRWWMPFIDHDSHRYSEKSGSKRAELFAQVKAMYKKADDILGEIAKDMGPEGTIVLSSDHGALPLFREVRLNNLFAKKGWLHYRFNKESAEFEIDWSRTRVVYLQMNNIYIHPKGLGGVYRRASSPEYRKLRDEVRELVEGLEDPETHIRAASHIWTHEDAGQAGLPQNRVGDLVIANAPQYNWSEDLSEDGRIFAGTLKGGYKQGVWPEKAEGMLTPFVIMGPGIKKGCRLAEPIRHVDQFATIAEILGVKSPYQVEGRVLKEILER